MVAQVCLGASAIGRSTGRPPRSLRTRPAIKGASPGLVDRKLERSVFFPIYSCYVIQPTFRKQATRHSTQTASARYRGTDLHTDHAIRRRTSHVDPSSRSNSAGIARAGLVFTARGRWSEPPPHRCPRRVGRGLGDRWGSGAPRLRSQRSQKRATRMA